jgi:hypothetical protein
LIKKAISFRGVEEATSTYKVKSFIETCFQVSQYQNQLGFGPEGNFFLGHDFWCNCCDDSRDMSESIRWFSPYGSHHMGLMWNSLYVSCLLHNSCARDIFVSFFSFEAFSQAGVFGYVTSVSEPGIDF